MIKSKQAVIFDLFHTLTAIERSWGPYTYEILGVDQDAWNGQLLEHSPDRLEGRMTDPSEIISTLARAINPGISDETIAKAVMSRAARFRKAVVEIPESNLRVLASLKKNDKKVALVSNADASEIDGWGDSPLTTLLDEVIFSCEVGSQKPKPEIYQICLERLGLEAKDCTFVGDGGSNELKGAQAVGLTTVMVTAHIEHYPPEKLAARRTHADYVIRTLGELVTR